jgi:hypothetical protein
MTTKTITKYRPIKIVPPERSNVGYSQHVGYYRQLDILFDDVSSAKGYIADQKECTDYLIEEVTLVVREREYNSNTLNEERR